MQVLNEIRTYVEYGRAFHPSVLRKFQDVVGAVTRAENTVYLTLKRTNISIIGLEEIIYVISPIEELLPPHQTILQSIRELKKAIEERGHVSYAQAYGFHTIRIESVEVFRRKIKILCETLALISSSLSKKAEHLKSELSQSLYEEQFRSEGKKYAILAEMYGEQQKLLARLERFGSQAGNVIAAAMSAAH